MQRMRWRLVWALLFTTLLLSLLMVSVAVAAPPHQDATQSEEDGQEYIVQAGDWLSTISQEFLGSSAAYTRIVEATNAKAESDPRYTPITDPDQIRVGQSLWIPMVSEDAAAPISPTAGMSDAVGVVTATNSVTATRSVTVVNGEAVSPSVRFVAPVNGALVTSPVDVEMAAAGVTVEPAGEIHENAGHFHILIDTDFIAPGELIPFDEQHRHFGQGQLTTTLDLEPGVHTLRLQFADGAHLALAGAAYRDEITVTVSSQQSASSQQTVQPEVYFVAPQDGALVTSPVAVEMAAEGFTIEPAGELHENAGHFHILLDTDFIAPGELIPFDEQHLHFGQGQLTTTLDLEPGIHTLRLQAADGAHLALEGEAYRDQITVTVQAGD